MGDMTPGKLDALVLRDVVRRVGRFPVAALRFPLRAVLGLEALWKTVLFGSIALVVVYKLVIAGSAELAGLRPIPGYALPVGYFLLLILFLAQAWFSVALWRSAGRLADDSWKMFIRLFVLLAAATFMAGDINAMSVLDQFLSPSQGALG